MTMGYSEDGWRPLTQTDLSQAFVEEWDKEEPDRSVISAWFDANFESQNGMTIDRKDLSMMQKYAKWLAYQQLNSSTPFSIRKYPRLHTLVFDDYSSKVNRLSQRHCYICQPDGPIHVMPIRITPRSRQNIDTLDRRAFHAAIAHWASSRKLTIDLSRNLCLAITFVLDLAGTDKDLDNMVKILQDAIASAFKFNDRNVHHLDLLKLIFPVEEEYVYVRIMNSRINEHHDVLAPIEHHSFGCGPPLRLEDFVVTQDASSTNVAAP